MTVDRSATVLLVEDDPDDEALTLRAFRGEAARELIVVARDGAEALDLLLAEGPRGGPLPTLILLDLNLPKLDGLEVLRRIRADERTRLLPVVILTSSDEDADRVAGYRLGANSYVRKPADFLTLRQIVRQLRAYWLALNEPPPPCP